MDHQAIRVCREGKTLVVRPLKSFFLMCVFPYNQEKTLELEFVNETSYNQYSYIR